MSRQSTHEGSFVRKALTLLMSASVSALAAGAAHAQETSEEPAEEETIVVTGSRVARPNFETPAPTTSIDAATIQESGLPTLGDVLQRAPAVAVGLGLSNAQNSTDAGATFANLRGLGSFRTLTLVDGRRRVPGSLTNSSVDLSSIPPSMVERVDIVTGGTSAVYGADAVTGVINVILDRDYEGLEFDFSMGAPQAGGAGDAQQASLHWGDDFAGGRGDINVGVSYSRSSVLRATDRDFSSGRNFIFFESNFPGYSFDGVVPTNIVRRDPTTFLYANTGTIWYWNGSAYEYYTADPELRPQTSDEPPFFYPWNGVAGFGWGTGGDGFAFDEYGLLRAGFESLSALGSIDYDLGGGATWYLDAEIASSQTESPFQPNFHPANGDFLYVYRDNPLLPTSVQQFMDDRGLPYLYVQRTHDDLGVRTGIVDRLNYTVASGVRGDWGDNWRYDVFAQYGEMQIDSRTTNTLIRSNYLNAIDAISDGAGGAMCRSAAARAEGCVPIVAFGRNDTISQAQRDYLLHDLETELSLDQTLIGGSIAGDLFNLPAGPLGTAFGFEYREENLSFRDDPLNQAGALLLNAPTPDNDGGFDVWEIYGEAVAPLLRNLPLIHSLQLEAAVRYSEYSHAGNSTTWKLGGMWSPIEALRFRYTTSRSVRAPTITDSFSPGITSFSFITDPCNAAEIPAAPDPAVRAANCTALGVDVAGGYTDPTPTVTRQVITGGNADLGPETSDSWTTGVIWSPTDRLRMSIDYWNIELADAISALGVGEILNNCVDSASTANEFCGLITRDPGTDAVVSIENRPINIDRLEARGVDAQLQYSFDAPWLFDGEVSLGVGATYLEEYNIVDVSPAGSFVSEEAGEVQGTPLPQWRGNLSAAYMRGPLRVSWFGNYIGSMEIDVAAPAGTYQAGFDHIDAVMLHSLYAQYEASEGLVVRAGINNLTDEAPPANPFTFMGAGGLYDNNGRYFWIGATIRR